MSSTLIGNGNNLPNLLTGATGTGAGTPVKSIAKDKAVQVDGITTATVQIQVSNDYDPADGSGNWYTVQTVTADNHYQLESSAKYIRANVSAYTSGTITVTVSV